MKWRVMVGLTGNDGIVRLHEVSAGGTNMIECSAGTVGLTLADGKRTLAGLQDHLALVHFQTEGEMAPTPSCYAVTGWRRTESGRPATNIRFSTAAPMAASVCWAAKPRARSRGPISVL
jgi:hypothetical protein